MSLTIYKKNSLYRYDFLLHSKGFFFYCDKTSFQLTMSVITASDIKGISQKKKPKSEMPNKTTYL